MGQSTHTSERPRARPGGFLAIGKRDDTGDIIVSSIDDLPSRVTMSDLCMRALREMGQRNPLVYEFIALIYAPVRGGAKVVLDQGTLRRFVYSRWGRGRK